jgi:hypothetical protein
MVGTVASPPNTACPIAAATPAACRLRRGDTEKDVVRAAGDDDVVRAEGDDVDGEAPLHVVGGFAADPFVGDGEP